MKKYKLFLGISLGILGAIPAAEASVYTCHKGECSYLFSDFPFSHLLEQVRPIFQMSNARLDFCEADESTRTCVSQGLNWQATSTNNLALFSIPVARVVPHKNTLDIEYLVAANTFLPDCRLSPTTLAEGENQTLRIASDSFSCDITDFQKTYIQNTFFVDFIDFDRAVLGGHYLIRTQGEFQAEKSGYMLMQFTDGTKRMPLLMTPPVTLAETPTIYQTTPAEGDFVTDVKEAAEKSAWHIKDWWQQLKYSLNFDDGKPNPNHWWNRLVDKAKKIFFLEPLN